jgi:hypothetical protein
VSLTTRVPEIVTVPGKKVLIVNVALVCPDGTTTLVGTLAINLLLLESDTDVPLACAGPFRVTVPVEDVPKLTDVGFSVSDASWGALRTSVALRCTLL